MVERFQCQQRNERQCNTISTIVHIIRTLSLWLSTALNTRAALCISEHADVYFLKWKLWKLPPVLLLLLLLLLLPLLLLLKLLFLALALLRDCARLWYFCDAVR